ncbi:hypothetical protein HQN60_09315 [Deefgea piscis]|uniref:Tetratricopeptide repeat protein n=1 Tax=Deefgea piscis TaxID=2739061 RepID=A0A6M8SNP4_9NEIS|nr:hypothetical protein [Deefgea piscis]QKJ66882.1 hypothetical protein HQN60_09315 [Deefgea piscis]
MNCLSNKADELAFSQAIETYFFDVDKAYWDAGSDSRDLCENLVQRCKNENHPWLGYAYVLYGRILLAFDENTKALSILQKGKKLIEKNKDIEHLPFSMLWLGVALERNCKYTYAIEVWVKTIDLALELTQLEYGVEAYLNASMVYYHLGQNENADVLMRNGLKLAESIHSNKLIAKSGIFLMEGLLLAERYDAALVLLARIEPYALAHGDMTWLVQICNGYAISYWNNSNHELGIFYFEVAVAIANHYKMTWGYCISVINYGECLQGINKLADIFPLLLNSKKILKEINHNDLDARLNYLLYQAYRESGDYLSALSVLRAYERQAIRHISNEIGEKGFRLNLNRLDKARALLVRTHIKFEKLAGWVVPGVSLQHLRQFRLRCESADFSDRVIELTFDLLIDSVIEQRISILLNDYCALSDLWIFVPPCRYIIYPKESSFILMDFAQSLAMAIENLPWDRYGKDRVKVKFKLQLANETMLRQVDVLLKKELEYV